MTPLIREMLPAERNMVLSDWKKDLWSDQPPWGRALPYEEWWALIDHVIERITLGSCKVYMACHESEPLVPLGWAAARDGAFLHMHARMNVHREPELAAFLERALTEHVQGRPGTFNPFMELKR